MLIKFLARLVFTSPKQFSFNMYKLGYSVAHFHWAAGGKCLANSITKKKWAGHHSQQCKHVNGCYLIDSSKQNFLRLASFNVNNLRLWNLAQSRLLIKYVLLTTYMEVHYVSIEDRFQDSSLWFLICTSIVAFATMYIVNVQGTLTNCPIMNNSLGSFENQGWFLKSTYSFIIALVHLW